VIQLVEDFKHSRAELDLIRDLARASGRPVSVSLAHSSVDALHYRDFLSFLDDANGEGLTITAQAAVRGIGLLMGLENTLHPFMTNPVWRAEIASRPVDEQLRRMREPGVRARILEAHGAERDPNLIGGRLIYKWEMMYPVDTEPDYEPPPERSIAAQARDTGRAPEEVAYDIMVSADGPRFLVVYAVNYVDGNLDAVHEMLTHPHTLPGLSDGGAHVGTVCDASFPSTLLMHWARDRSGDRLGLPFVVQRQCRDTALAVGLGDRGVLAPGYRGDVNVIDFDGLSVSAPEVVYDLPSGGRRLIQRARGYLHTLLGGVEIYADGRSTGELPGRLVRGATGR
jgi:N-acyl-D-aspartate/D-glutamate deacylase